MGWTASRSIMASASLLGILLFGGGAGAQGATWTGAGADNNWSNAANWNGGVPGPTGIAIFDASAMQTTINVDTPDPSMTFQFDAGASQFTFNSSETWWYAYWGGTGLGIHNQSNYAPIFNVIGNNAGWA